MQHICLHKEIALQNALRHHTALLSRGRFSDGENFLPGDAFSKKISDRQKFRVECCPPRNDVTDMLIRDVHQHMNEKIISTGKAASVSSDSQIEDTKHMTIITTN